MIFFMRMWLLNPSSHCVQHLTQNLCSMGRPASSYALAGIAFKFNDACTPHCLAKYASNKKWVTQREIFIDLHILMLVRVRRGGSRGFMLHEESLDDQFLRESLQQEREWIDKFRNKKPGASSRLDTSNSSKFSFSTEYSSGMTSYDKLYTAMGCSRHSDRIYLVLAS